MTPIRLPYVRPCSCIDCPQHEVRPDPDPLDWFCDDDVKVVCMLTGKNCTVACRPYMTRRETTPLPGFCPLPENGS